MNEREELGSYERLPLAAPCDGGSGGVRLWIVLVAAFIAMALGVKLAAGAGWIAPDFTGHRAEVRP